MKINMSHARGWLPALGLVFCGLAQAGPITEVFSATISSGTDTNGLFGTAGASLAGDTLNVTFTYDPSLMSNLSSGSADVYVSSGVATASASFEINGHQHSYTNASGFTQAVLQPTGGNGSELNLDYFGPDVQFLMYSSSPWTSGNLNNQAAMDAFIANPKLAQDLVEVGGDDLFFSGRSSAEPADAPEPGSVALLGLGLGLVTIARRRLA